MIQFGGPAHYKIIVQGKMTNELFHFFNNIEISKEEISDREIDFTKLVAKIKDQAELSGIINALYEWRYPILLVECAGEILKDS